MAWRYVRTIPDAGSFQRDALREIVKGDAKPFRVLTTDEECPSLGSRPASAQPRRVAFFSDPSRLFKSDYERCRTRSSLCAPPIPDAMCARLSCAHNHTPASACNMTAARQGLARIEAVGLVDAYQESLCVFAALATDALPAFCDCENVTRWQSFVPRAPRPPTRSTSGLSASSRKSIEDRSRHDTALYVAAKERLIASARVLETRYGRRIWCEREGGTRLADVTRVTNLPRPPSPLKFLHFPKAGSSFQISLDLHNASMMNGHAPIAADASAAAVRHVAALFRHPEERLISLYGWMRTRGVGCCFPSDFGWPSEREWRRVTARVQANGSDPTARSHRHSHACPPCPPAHTHGHSHAYGPCAPTRMAAPPTQRRPSAPLAHPQPGCCSSAPLPSAAQSAIPRC